MNSITKLTWHTFLVLIFGFIVLFTSLVFIVSAFWHLNHNEFTPTKLSNTIIRIVNLAKTVKPQQLPTSLKHMYHPGIKLSLTKKPPGEFLPLYIINLNSIRQKVLQNPYNVQLTFPLTDNNFLKIQTHIEKKLSLRIQFYAALVVWLAALIAFCYYIVKRLSTPLAYFVEGSKRFAKDHNSPPLPEVGPKSTRAAFKAFNQMQAHMRQLLQSRTQMLAAISHDLRTPITRLKLRLENINDSELTAKMHKDLNHMESMIHSILQFSQNDFEHELSTEFDMNAFLQSICDDLQDNQMDIDFIPTSSKLIYCGQMQALRRAFENLLTNGIKYGKSVTVNLQKERGKIKIVIADQGPGIPESEWTKVFQPFYRLDKARQTHTGGAGLGLTTTLDIIRSHGGEIKFKKEKNFQVIVFL